MGFGSVMDFAFNSAGTLYAIDNTTGNSLYTINLTTGVGTLVTNITGADGLIMCIIFDASKHLYATSYTSNSSFYGVNLATGAATFIGSTGLAFAHGGDFVPSAATPEPSTIVTAALGILGGITLMARKRKTIIA